MDIQLKINSTTLVLGCSPDSSLLNRTHLNKMGLLSRTLVPIQKLPGDTIYFAKNPRISAFGGAVDVTANLDVSLGSNMMYGTSCYAVFNSGRLRYIICSVIQNETAAYAFTKDIRAAAQRVLGTPSWSGEPVVWKAGNEAFVSEIGSSGSTAFLHWQIV